MHKFKRLRLGRCLSVKKKNPPKKLLSDWNYRSVENEKI